VEQVSGAVERIYAVGESPLHVPVG
jgi:hypothetical protein